MLELFTHVSLTVAAGHYTQPPPVYSFMPFVLTDGGLYHIKLCLLCWLMLGRWADTVGRERITQLNILLIGSELFYTRLTFKS